MAAKGMSRGVGLGEGKVVREEEEGGGGECCSLLMLRRTNGITYQIDHSILLK